MTTLLRIAAALFALLGAVMLYATYLIVTAHHTALASPARDVIQGILMIGSGIAALFLWRWAAVLMSLLAMAMGICLAWAFVFHSPPPRGVLLGLLNLAVAAIPAVCTAFAWRNLR